MNQVFGFEVLPKSVRDWVLHHLQVFKDLLGVHGTRDDGRHHFMTKGKLQCCSIQRDLVFSANVFDGMNTSGDRFFDGGVTITSTL